MKVRVEKCRAGPKAYYFRCTFPDYNRTNVGHNADGDDWCREYAAELRDYAVTYYGVTRNSIRVV